MGLSGGGGGAFFPAIAAAAPAPPAEYGGGAADTVLGLRPTDEPGGGGGAFLYDAAVESVEFVRETEVLVEVLRSRVEPGERPREVCTNFSDTGSAYGCEHREKN